jgi:RNA polymerase sigma-70 factor (ECF subfamily)
MNKISSLLSTSLVDKEKLLMDFKREYDLHHAYVRSLIYWMVRSDVVDDLVQETFLKAWRGYSKFSGDSSFKTWIHKIAINSVYDFSRKNAKPVMRLQVEHVDSEISTKDFISKALLSMDLKFRELLVLCYKFEYTNKEVAILLGLKEGTVKSSLHSAKKEFTYFCSQEGVFDE